MPSLPRSGLGLTLLAMFGAGALAQQARRTEQPTQKIAAQASAEPIKELVRPARFTWSEMVQLQASLPPMDLPVEQPKRARTVAQPGEVQDLEVPMPELLRGFDHAIPYVPGGQQGDIERIGPCAGFPGIPPASLSLASALDSSGVSYPPNGAASVGTHHLMTMSNESTLIQDRLGAFVSSVSTLAFWAALAPPSVSYCRLEFVSYIGTRGRWIASARGGSGVGACSILFAISDSEDPTGGWDFYSIVADPTLAPPTFPDGLRMGYNATWAAVSADMYSSLVAGGNQGSRLYTFDLSEAVAGGPVTATTLSAGYTTATTGLFTPVVNFRNVPTRDLDGSISSMWILNSRTTSGTSVAWQFFRIVPTGPDPETPVPTATPGSAFGGSLSLGFVPINYSNLRQAVFQVGDVRGIDPLEPDGTFASTRARLADAVVRNGHIFVVHNSGLPGPQTATATQNGVSFYELDPATVPFFNPVSAQAPFLQDVQITDGVNTSLIYPSIAVNCANDAIIGFMRADATRDLEAAYVFRLGSDLPNVVGPITTLKAGESSWWQVQPAPGSASLGAWGFYSSSAVDPNDDTTLWTLQPYAATRVGGADADSRWGTWWGRFGDCETLPVITDHPDPVDSCIGNNESFSVSATTGSNPLTYQWRLNGVPIPGETLDTINLTPVVSADEGVYDCVVCGCGQEISLPALLDLDQPTITMQPTDYTAGLGEAAGFQLSATPSIGSNSYQWFHNGNPVGFDFPFITIAPIVGQDYGPYYCVVTDGCGPIQSDTVLLKPIIVGNKTKPTAPITDMVVVPQAPLGCVGGSVEFSLLASPAGSSYQWRKDGVNIPSETNATLVVSGLSFGSAGQYDVLVDTGSEILDSHAAILSMADAPVITSQPSDVIINSSQAFTFTVVATGVGPLTYQWKHEPVTGSFFTEIPGATGASYHVPEASASDAGRYRCTIRNRCGVTNSRTVRLTFL